MPPETPPPSNPTSRPNDQELSSQGSVFSFPLVLPELTSAEEVAQVIADRHKLYETYRQPTPKERLKRLFVRLLSVAGIRIGS